MFTYSPNRSTEDAIAHLYFTALSHLECRKELRENAVQRLQFSIQHHNSFQRVKEGLAVSVPPQTSEELQTAL